MYVKAINYNSWNIHIKYVTPYILAIFKISGDLCLSFSFYKIVKKKKKNGYLTNLNIWNVFYENKVAFYSDKDLFFLNFLFEGVKYCKDCGK
jgi:hypothetical protein